MKYFDERDGLGKCLPGGTTLSPRRCRATLCLKNLNNFHYSSRITRRRYDYAFDRYEQGGECDSRSVGMRQDSRLFHIPANVPTAVILNDLH